MANVNPNNPDQARDSPKSTAEIFALNEIITVNVGPDKVAYGLHRGILVSKCPFFEKCLRSGMKEEQEKMINLPEELPGVFDTLVQWMYTGKIVVKPRMQISFIDAYLLADKFCMHDLQNSIMDALREQCPKFAIRPNSLDHVWKHSAEHCELRKFCFDEIHFTLSRIRQWAGYTSHDNDTTEYKRKLHEFRIEYEKEFKNELDELMQSGSPMINALFWKLSDSDSPTPDPAFLSGCVYHVHKNGEKCMSSA